MDRLKRLRGNPLTPAQRKRLVQRVECRFVLAFATVIVVFQFSNAEYFDIVVDVVAIRFLVDLSQCK